jgi:hypothetical protein
MESMGRSALIVVAALLAALLSCEASDEGREASPPPSSPAEAAPAPPAPAHEPDVAALLADAKRLEKTVKLARPGRDRLVAAQDAANAWSLWSEASGKPLPASARRIAKIAAKEAKAAALEEAKESHSFAPERECCRHCTSGCPCGDTCISCAKTCHKGPGCAC